MTGGEDGRICAWSAVAEADAADVVPKRAAPAAQNGAALRQNKRRKQEGAL
jgi:hypothetical protein